jgi:molecular chaperone GrpE
MKKQETTEEVNEQTAQHSDESTAAPEVAVSAETLQALTAEHAALTKQRDELQQQLLRLQADFDNFRRRTRLEKEDAAKYAALPVITKLLPALDNLERAIAAGRLSSDIEVFAKGVEMTANHLLEALQSEGLQAMEATGTLFNPDFHQAVMQTESADYADGEIVEELQKGYILKDKVIRPAMVKVNKA